MTFLPTKMPDTFARNLTSLQNRTWLPPALLLLALASVFLFDGNRSYFRGVGEIHDQLSAKNMAIVENLSIDHNFVMFTLQVLDADSEPTYDLYGRFPIGSYALIKLATLPFGDNLSAKIYAARTLMLLFFAAAAFMAYLALRRLASNRWIALTATLLAFSSPYCLYYVDAITSEAMVDIFGALLVFHGMVIFEQQGRFRQLLAKTCIALLLGWHVYALLLPFIAFGLMRDLIKTRLDASVPPNALPQLKHTALSLLRSRYMALGVIALAFGMSMLTINFTSEYFALNRETSLTELPSFSSMIKRIGVDAYYRNSYREYLSWPAFPERQFYRVGAMSLPYAFFPMNLEVPQTKFSADLPRSFIILGIAASGASLIGLLFIRRHKILLAALTLSGFFWTLPMRHNTAIPDHSFEALLYIGVALTLFSLVLLCVYRLAGDRLIAALSVAALLIFAFSALRMSQLNNSRQTAGLQEAAVADFEVIRNMTDGKAILINSMPRFVRSGETNYYLSGRLILYGYQTLSPERSPDFIVTGARANGLASLTPQNRTIFLYEWNDYYRHITKTIEKADAQIISSDFDVYLNGNILIYVKDDCNWSDTSKFFFMKVYPVNESDLPPELRQHGSEGFNISFYYNDTRQSAERCVAVAQLPGYDIARISTGQYTRRDEGSTRYRLWKGEFRPSDRVRNDRLRHISETIAQAGEPLIRSDFDVYINDNMLIYVKDNCSGNDTDAPFFLAVYPVNESDLPPESRRHGFQNLDFYFHENSIRHSRERCDALVQLPDYAIARIHTGQYAQRADGSTQHIWEREVRLTEASR